MKKFTLIATALAVMTAFCAQNAGAQATTERTISLDPINNVSVANNITVKFNNSDDSYINIYATDFVMESVTCETHNRTLKVFVDSKKYKAACKEHKDVTPSIRIEVYAPEFREISVCNDVIVDSFSKLLASELTLNASNNAKVVGLSVEAKKVEVNANNKAEVKCAVSANSVALNASNSSVASIDVDCTKISVSTSNGAKVDVKGLYNRADLKAGNASSIGLSGGCEVLNITTSNNAKIDAASVPAGAVIAKMNGGSAWVFAQDKISVAIENNAYLVFAGNPAIDLTKIQESTLLRPSDDKKKK